MSFLDASATDSPPDRPEIILSFPDLAQRDRAWARLQHLDVHAADIVDIDLQAVAHALEILAVIQNASTTPALEQQEARARLTFIAGLTFGLIQSLGGMPPAIPEDFFQQRRPGAVMRGIHIERPDA